MLPLLTLTLNDWIFMGTVYCVLLIVAAWFVHGLYSAAREQITLRSARYQQEHDRQDKATPT